MFLRSSKLGLVLQASNNKQPGIHLAGDRDWLAATFEVGTLARLTGVSGTTSLIYNVRMDMQHMDRNAHDPDDNDITLNNCTRMAVS